MDCIEHQTAEDDRLQAEPVPPTVLAAANRAKAEAQKISDERRTHRRIPGRALDWISVARVKYGPEVNIVDLSKGGVLLESDRPLKPGSRQDLEIAGPERSIVVPFGVLRSRISALAPKGAIYLAGCEFSRPLDLPELSAAAERAEQIDDPTAGEPSEALRTAVASPAPVLEPLMETVLREVATPEAQISTLGWAKLVARFEDGTILKGYNRDFDMTRPSFALLSSPEEGADHVSVPLIGLKAVFFVRDFEGKSEYRERKTFVGQTLGRRVHLTFKDGEMIIGTTQGYRAGGAGFFVTPADPRANNVRIFIVSSAVRQVRFP
jgi:Family of unknown function (DUF6982)